MANSTAAMVRSLATIGRDFYARGWVFGTSGNFSAVLARDPLLLAITASGISKGRILPRDVLLIDQNGRIDQQGRTVGQAQGRPSAEALLHVLVARARGAGAVLHTHSVWSTVVSELDAARGGCEVRGFEMLKGLEGVTSHDHREWIPIIENDQDMPRLASAVEAVLSAHPSAHAFLLRRHGLYTWGADLAQATRHIEILEFLFETTARLRTWREPEDGERRS